MTNKKPLEMMVDRFVGWMQKVNHSNKRHPQSSILTFTTSCRGKFEDEWINFLTLR